MAQPQSKPVRAQKPTPALIKAYLVLYNTLSAAGWGYVLYLTATHLVGQDVDTPLLSETWSSISRFLTHVPYFSSLGPYRGSAALWAPWIVRQLPAQWAPVIHRATTAFAAQGWQTSFVQSFMLLDVIHALFGWVRSPVGTVAAQVASRLYIVYGIVGPFEHTHTIPTYASMVLAWSVTEVIRYSFYAFTLLGGVPYPLLWLRYTLFYILYPIGAGSEASLIYATLPKALLADWNPYDYFRGSMFVIWWIALYVLYTYMIGQRRKVLGNKGKTLGTTPKSR